MKIEKINDNQIKCTLSKQDLEERKIRLSELVYGSDKAKQLFRDMMHMAAVECGFDGEEMPIMVEAIPSVKDSLVLIITKVDNPEELDTRFSNFTPLGDDEDMDDLGIGDLFADGSDNSEISIACSGHGLGSDVQNNFTEALGKLRQSAIEKQRAEEKFREEAVKPLPEEEQYRTFRFDNMEQMGEYAKAACFDFQGHSNLYKDPVKGKYYMVVFLKDSSAADFNQACNIASEYGDVLKNRSLPFYKEHYKLIIKDDAVQRLADML
ncbi:MAG: adaptor protein MecA [Lachnospiraceae bacterium]